MATKSQLKTYFEKGDIPTSTQFGELIDSLLSVPSEDTMDRPNQNLFFGNGEENPYMQGVRTISMSIDTNVINMYFFISVRVKVSDYLTKYNMDRNRDESNSKRYFLGP